MANIQRTMSGRDIGALSNLLKAYEVMLYIMHGIFLAVKSYIRCCVCNLNERDRSDYTLGAESDFIRGTGPLVSFDHWLERSAGC